MLDIVFLKPERNEPWKCSNSELNTSSEVGTHFISLSSLLIHIQSSAESMGAWQSASSELAPLLCHCFCTTVTVFTWSLPRLGFIILWSCEGKKDQRGAMRSTCAVKSNHYTLLTMTALLQTPLLGPGHNSYLLVWLRVQSELAAVQYCITPAITRSANQESSLIYRNDNGTADGTSPKSFRFISGALVIKSP